ncbi:PREDICTED: nucleolar protein 12 [Nanorana parkeri]|uniref:nucleolar protein 12 n=1 Tax=Nanorana parkeri TaxID=125878 RepID=UPI00085481D5|nr:PREDICTED: nucleolar protein 12 [Nanorana parkeri]
MGKKKHKASRRELVFDEEKRREYLTGFHKRKLQRRKAAVEEIKLKIKEEQKRMKEERHKEYMKMLKEREEALEEIDEIERLVTAKTESFLYDHPNHTVTVTTISDLDLSGVGLLPPGSKEVEFEDNDKNQEESSVKLALPKKAGAPILSKRISSLTKTLHVRSKCKSRKRPSRTMDGKKQSIRPPGRTSKAQRRRQTGKTGRNRE